MLQRSRWRTCSGTGQRWRLYSNPKPSTLNPQPSTLEKLFSICSGTEGSSWGFRVQGEPKEWITCHKDGWLLCSRTKIENRFSFSSLGTKDPSTFRWSLRCASSLFFGGRRCRGSNPRPLVERLLFFLFQKKVRVSSRFSSRISWFKTGGLVQGLV